jgi:hypothetical protein
VVLVGATGLTTHPDSNIPGQAQAYPYAAMASGTASSFRVYVDTGNAASSVVIGLYRGNTAGPTTLIASCSVVSPTAGAWNSCVTSAPVTAGKIYWMAILGPAGTGAIAFRDSPDVSSGLSRGSAQSNLSVLPATWTSANVTWGNAPASVYART